MKAKNRIDLFGGTAVSQVVDIASEKRNNRNRELKGKKESMARLIQKLLESER
jgi:hypothetical protein